MLFVCAAAARARELPQGVAWTREFSEEIQHIAGDEKVVVAHVGHQAYGLSAQDGRLLWTIPEFYANEVLVEQGTVVISNAFDVTVYNLDNGLKRWTRSGEAWALKEGRLWQISDGEIRSYDIRTGGMRWSCACGQASQMWVGPRGVLVREINPSTLRWYSFDGESTWSMDLEPKRAYPTSDGGWLLIEDLLQTKVDSKGKVLWRDDLVYADLINGVVVGKAEYESKLSGVSARTGRPLWMREGVLLFVERAVGPLVLVEKFNFNAILFDARTGREIFRGSGGPAMPQPVYDDGVFTLLLSTGLERRDARTGRLLVRYPESVLSSDSTYFYNSPVGYAAGGRSFIGALKSMAAVGPGPGKRWAR